MSEEMISRRFQLSSFQIIILGFAGVILLGALLLMLPIATQEGCTTPFNEALFTATSAVCVSRATPASRRSTATGGGRPRGSTPTEICATSRRGCETSKMCTSVLIGRHGGTWRRWRGEGWGLSISTTLGQVSGRGQPCAKSPNQTGY